MHLLVFCLFLWTWNRQVNGFKAKASKFSVPIRVQSSILNEREELIYGHPMTKQNELYGPYLKKGKFSIELSLVNQHDDTPIVAHQAYVRFIHVLTKRETYFMMLRRKTTIQKKMYTSIDFSRRTREQLELENGVYRVEILIEDPIFKDALRWDLGTIELFFDMIKQDQEEYKDHKALEQGNAVDTVEDHVVITSTTVAVTVQPSIEEVATTTTTTTAKFEGLRSQEKSNTSTFYYGMNFISRLLAAYEKDPHFQENIYVIVAGSEMIALFGLILSVAMISLKKDPFTFTQTTTLYGAIYTSCCFHCVLVLYYWDFLSLHNAFWWGVVFGQSHFICMNCILAFGMGPIIEREQHVKVTSAQLTNASPHTNPHKPFQKKHKPARRY